MKEIRRKLMNNTPQVSPDHCVQDQCLAAKDNVLAANDFGLSGHLVACVCDDIVAALVELHLWHRGLVHQHTRWDWKNELCRPDPDAAGDPQGAGAARGLYHIQVYFGSLIK